MQSINNEYDLFGPWLLQVESEKDIPHQYFEYIDMIVNAKYCFKIPIQEERRKLAAGMLLYNKLILIEDAQIVELSVINHQISVKQLSFKDVLYVTHRGDLLNCEISLTTNETSLQIRYNLVSIDFASTVMGLLRESICSSSTSSDEMPLHEQKYSELQIFSYFCITENETNKPKILNYQPCLELGLLKSTNLFQSLNKYRLLDCMIMTNNTELIIANRGQAVIQEHDTNYKFGHTFIPLKYISGISQGKDEQFNDLKQVIINVGEQQVNIKVAQDFAIDLIADALMKK